MTTVAPFPSDIRVEKSDDSKREEDSKGDSKREDTSAPPNMRGTAKDVTLDQSHPALALLHAKYQQLHISPVEILGSWVIQVTRERPWFDLPWWIFPRLLRVQPIADSAYNEIVSSSSTCDLRYNVRHAPSPLDGMLMCILARPFRSIHDGSDKLTPWRMTSVLIMKHNMKRQTLLFDVGPEPMEIQAMTAHDHETRVSVGLTELDIGSLRWPINTADLHHNASLAESNSVGYRVHCELTASLPSLWLVVDWVSKRDVFKSKLDYTFHVQPAMAPQPSPRRPAASSSTAPLVPLVAAEKEDKADMKEEGKGTEGKEVKHVTMMPESVITEPLHDQDATGGISEASSSATTKWVAEDTHFDTTIERSWHLSSHSIHPRWIGHFVNPNGRVWFYPSGTEPSTAAIALVDENTSEATDSDRRNMVHALYEQRGLPLRKISVPAMPKIDRMPRIPIKIRKWPSTASAAGVASEFECMTTRRPHERKHMSKINVGSTLILLDGALSSASISSPLPSSATASATTQATTTTTTRTRFRMQCEYDLQSLHDITQTIMLQEGRASLERLSVMPRVIARVTPPPELINWTGNVISVSCRSSCQFQLVVDPTLQWGDCSSITMLRNRLCAQPSIITCSQPFIMDGSPGIDFICEAPRLDCADTFASMVVQYRAQPITASPDNVVEEDDDDNDSPRAATRPQGHPVIQNRYPIPQVPRREGRRVVHAVEPAVNRSLVTPTMSIAITWHCPSPLTLTLWLPSTWDNLREVNLSFTNDDAVAVAKLEDDFQRRARGAHRALSSTPRPLVVMPADTHRKFPNGNHVWTVRGRRIISSSSAAAIGDGVHPTSSGTMASAAVTSGTTDRTRGSAGYDEYMSRACVVLQHPPVPNTALPYGATPRDGHYIGGGTQIADFIGYAR